MRRGAVSGLGKKGAVPRLRFDKAATRVVAGLRASVEQIVPEGLMVLVTITAPIRLPAKTTEWLSGKVRTLASGGWRPREVSDTIHGNGIRIRVVKRECLDLPKVIGFVHNADSDADGILRIAGALVEEVDVVDEAHRLIYSVMAGRPSAG